MMIVYCRKFEPEEQQHNQILSNFVPFTRNDAKILLMIFQLRIIYQYFQ